jgi:diguanylate cyclase (GGDEF)-like protein/PAS domain S-box-containing protein
MSIATRLWLLIGIFSVAVVVDNVSEMVLHESGLRAEKEQQLQQLVETAHSILSYYENEARNGRMSENEARRHAIEAVEPMRYGEREYFWIHDLGTPLPRMVMHPTIPSLDGTILDQPSFLRATSSRIGSNGPYRPLQNQNLFLAMNDVVRSSQGEGFVKYGWPKPLGAGGVTTELFPKLSFVKRFGPWNWVIGTGIYMDDFEAAYWRSARIGIFKLVLSLASFCFMAWVILRTIIRPMHAMQAMMDSLRLDPNRFIDSPANQPLELGQISRSFQSLMGELKHSRKALQKSLENLRLAGEAIAAMSEGVVVTDALECIVSINPAFTRISGYSIEDVIGKTPRILKSGRHQDDFYRTMKTQLAASGSWSGEIWNRACDGHLYPEWLSISTLFNEQGEIANYIGVFSDITDRKNAESDLRVAARAFESQEGMFITDANARILRVNLAFNAITGYTAEEAIGKTPSLLRSGHHDATFYTDMRQCIEETGIWQGEIWNRRKNGEIFPEWLTISTVRGSDGKVTHHVCTLTDITHRKAAENEIKHLAFFDPLTQLPNRRLLLDRLQHALATSNRLGQSGALLFIDLDNFKALNDTMGHHTGDLLLKEVAIRLSACVREGDTVARLGGDEFVVLLEGLSSRLDQAAGQVKGIGTKILTALNESYLLGSAHYHNTPSIGVTLFENHQDSIEELLKRADLAMYQAKAAGRNTLRFFYPEMQSNANARATLEADLRLALQRQEFFLHYQEQVDQHGVLIGAEALARWQHPTRGLIPPDEFIPLAEETGWILQLGRWVLDTACQQLVAWSREPKLTKISLAVNVSAVQYRQPDFVKQVLDVLENTGANPRLLKLELTESVLLSNVDDIIAKMIELKAHGVTFSLDDFGTGYSSLSYLKRLPVDQLKIDRSFVRDLLADPADAAIVRTIVALAENWGLSVIAEGVETKAQWDCLNRHGCHNYQGYLFGRPGLADELSSFKVENEFRQ